MKERLLQRMREPVPINLGANPSAELGKEPHRRNYKGFKKDRRREFNTSTISVNHTAVSAISVMPRTDAAVATRHLNF
jgi:hypothetical protein